MFNIFFKYDGKVNNLYESYPDGYKENSLYESCPDSYKEKTTYMGPTLTAISRGAGTRPQRLLGVSLYRSSP